MAKVLKFSLPSQLHIDIESDSAIVFGDRELLVLNAYVPGIALAESGKADITIRHYESDTFAFSGSADTYTIHDAWHGQFPDDLYHLLYAVARRAFLEQGLYSVHSICVGNDDQILAVGHTGVGKTSLLGELSASHGLRMLASNKTLVSLKDACMTAVAGTRTVSVRASDVSFWSGEIENGTEKWGRHMFTIGGGREVRSPRPIKNVAIVRINDAVERCERLEPSAALHALFPYFLDAVNADVVLGGGKAVLSGAPSSENMATLARELASALERIPVYGITGSRQYTAGELFSL
jgi:hypothetical protein